jgi:hypothetical protein
VKEAHHRPFLRVSAAPFERSGSRASASSPVTNGRLAVFGCDNLRIAFRRYECRASRFPKPILVFHWLWAAAFGTRTSRARPHVGSGARPSSSRRGPARSSHARAVSPIGAKIVKSSGEAVILNDKLSRSVGYRSWLRNGPKTRVSVSAESRLGVRRELGREDADQERSQNWLAAIQRLSLDRPQRFHAGDREQLDRVGSRTGLQTVSRPVHKRPSAQV